MLCEGCGDIVEVDHEGRRAEKGVAMSRALPDRERWIGWVALAWILAAIAVIGGIAAISMAGFIEVARPNSFGRMETVTEPNVFIWSVAIGQAVSATLLAALFSMINSIYKNSCDQLKSTAYAEAREGGDAASEQRSGENGVRLTNVSSQSPLEKVLYTGCLITRLNDETVESVDVLVAQIIKGPNKIEFQTPAGESATKWIHLKPGQPLLVQGELAKIPS